MPRWFSADIGTYERGRTVKFTANNKYDALRRASKFVDRIYPGNEDAHVVQLYTCGHKHPSKAYGRIGHVIYDYFNGWLNDPTYLFNVANNFRRT